jgi:hypothetical protein
MFEEGVEHQIGLWFANPADRLVAHVRRLRDHFGCGGIVAHTQLGS